MAGKDARFVDGSYQVVANVPLYRSDTVCGCPSTVTVLSGGTPISVSAFSTRCGCGSTTVFPLAAGNVSPYSGPIGVRVAYSEKSQSMALRPFSREASGPSANNACSIAHGSDGSSAFRCNMVLKVCCAFSPESVFGTGSVSLLACGV